MVIKIDNQKYQLADFSDGEEEVITLTKRGEDSPVAMLTVGKDKADLLRNGKVYQIDSEMMRRIDKLNLAKLAEWMLLHQFD